MLTANSVVTHPQLKLITQRQRTIRSWLINHQHSIQIYLLVQSLVITTIYIIISSSREVPRRRRRLTVANLPQSLTWITITIVVVVVLSEGCLRVGVARVDLRLKNPNPYITTININNSNNNRTTVVNNMSTTIQRPPQIFYPLPPPRRPPFNTVRLRSRQWQLRLVFMTNLGNCMLNY